MPRGLDHIVHAVRDLDAAAALYRRLGFTVGARNRHSWGTHNHIVQLPGFFIEPLTLAEPEKLGTDGFSRLFGAYNGEFLKRTEGLSILILESSDAASDEKSFRDAGIAASDVMRFEREGKKPDGSAVKVAFSLAFAEDKGAPDIHFATCQQHDPQNFWNPDFQQHANSARGVAGIVIVAEKPTEHRDFLAAFSGQTDVRTSGNTITANTPRGEITIVDEAAFHTAYGTAPPSTARGARLAAVRFVVTDIAAAEDALAAAELAASVEASRIVVDPQSAMGATVVFEAAAG